MRTHVTKGAECIHAWHVIDANGVVLGRLACEAAVLLRGKHKPNFSTHLDNGDCVVIVNADKVVLSGRKIEYKERRRYSGFPGGMKVRPYNTWIVDHPEEVVRKAVRGMLPKNRLGRQLLTKIKIYRGAEHPHTAQQPVPHIVKSSRPPRGRA
ncbi:MAG: 50S ribosomal protein L13 [bacterium]